MPFSRQYNGVWEVYLLTDPRNQLAMYVGCAKCTIQRLDDHTNNSYHLTTPLGSWFEELRSIGRGPNCKLLECGEGIGWSTAESKWIAFYRKVNPHLLNRTSGGAGSPGREVSEDTRRKMSLSHKGQKPTEKNKQARIEACRVVWERKSAESLKRYQQRKEKNGVPTSVEM